MKLTIFFPGVGIQMHSLVFATFWSNLSLLKCMSNACTLIKSISVMNWTVDFYGMLQSNLNPLGKVQLFWEGHFFNLPLCLEFRSNFKKAGDFKKMWPSHNIWTLVTIYYLLFTHFTKVHILWELHKIWRNLQSFFDTTY